MDLKARANVIRSMDTIARAFNDENLCMTWLSVGVADGDVNGKETDKDLEMYCEDEEFKDLMGLFVSLMYRARQDANGEAGVLYCDGVVSE